jgi:tetratricopeptide (TPR) repeat protein
MSRRAIECRVIEQETSVTEPVGDAQKLLQAIVSKALAGNYADAEASARALEDRTVAAQAWRVLSEIYANSQRWPEAREAIDVALQHEPQSRELRQRRALLLEQQGRNDEALRELSSLAAEALDTPQLLVQFCRALQFAGRDDESIALLERGTERWPADARVQKLLAHAYWQRGDGERCTRELERAIGKFPGELPLRLVAADVQRNAGNPRKALELLEPGLEIAPDHPALLTSIGVLLELLDRPDEALSPLRAAAARAPQSAQVKRNLLATLLRLSQHAEAARLCDELLAAAPDDQLLIAHRATAYRLANDPRYAWLHDYERLVRVYHLAPPPEFAGIADFNSRFANRLELLHRAQVHPLGQSLFGGTQTGRNLPADDPLVAQFLAMIDTPIRDYISRLRPQDREHPADRRATRDFRIAGSWSVQLRPGGFHANHVHPQGWISSAYYLELPTMPAEDAAQSGWLKFGEAATSALACPADHFIRPEPGMLVLFPSYMWHGTVPFESGGRRLTAAFDVVPA